MKPGDLVRLPEASFHDEFTVGSLDTGGFGGFTTPDGSLAVIVRIVESERNPGEEIYHVMISDGRIGWVYPEDCEALDD